jgi:hypothetical protein
MKIEDFKNLTFALVKDVPIISPPKFTPLLADPTVLLPNETPDKKWHLFAHTVFGIQHYVSENGIDWKKTRYSNARLCGHLSVKKEISFIYSMKNITD